MLTLIHMSYLQLPISSQGLECQGLLRVAVTKLAVVLEDLGLG